jgi:CRP-like cAMP-binding protein/tetratricopeptide (TPR) repeat protein
LKRIERSYQDGQIIFREGAPSDGAFVIVGGTVELVKSTSSGEVRLSLLSAGEMFGETGIVDRAARSVTARAVGPVNVEAFDREAFLTSLAERPDVALKVIAGLSERLRVSADMIALRAPASTVVGGRRMDWFEILLSMFGLEDLIEDRPRDLQFRVARLANDPNGRHTVQIASAIGRARGIRAKALPAVIETDAEQSLGQRLAAAVREGRQILARERADLLIWGGVDELGETAFLRFVSVVEDEDHPGSFLASDTLSLPADLTPEYGQLVTAVALAAMVPADPNRRRRRETMLLPALEAAQAAAPEMPIELSRSAQASLQTCYGNIAAAIGHQRGDAAWYRMAADAYRSVLEILNRDGSPVPWATVQRHLALVLYALAERGGGPEVLEKAIESLREALEIFTREEFPWEWASLQHRLGAALYKLDLIDGDLDILKEAVAAFQAALGVFSRTEAPNRWADVKNSLGQALQIWGDLARSPELFERAVQCCHEALSVRTREGTPLAWAATQNNLGSALFMLGRQTEDTLHIEAAAEAFGRALDIYRTQDAAKLAAVTEKNLAKAEDLLRGRMARQVARLYWEPAEPEPDPLPLPDDRVEERDRENKGRRAGDVESEIMAAIGQK